MGLRLRLDLFRQEPNAVSALPVKLPLDHSLECEWDAHEWCDGCGCECHIDKGELSWLCKDDIGHNVCVAKWCQCKCHKKPSTVSKQCEGTVGHFDCQAEWCECQCHEADFT